jgi:hypothetical protein
MEQLACFVLLSNAATFQVSYTSLDYILHFPALYFKRIQTKYIPLEEQAEYRLQRIDKRVM